MKRRLALTLALCPLLIAAMEVPPTGRHLGSVTGGDFNEAHLVIDKRCTSCHSAKVIDEAIASGKDMLKIQHRMEQRGARQGGSALRDCRFCSRGYFAEVAV